MQDKTSEFSFILKPSKYGVGVFAAHSIKKSTHLRLFGGKNTSIMRNKSVVPESFHIYCVDRGDELSCPADFGAMPIGWYLNHSFNPNAAHKNYNYYALKNIQAGEEITIDYNTLEESEEAKDNYYKNKFS